MKRIPFWIALVSVYSSVAVGDYVCPQLCYCNETVVRCDGFIPAVIPNYVKEVELVDLKQNDLFDGAFCDSGWNSVTNLSIVCKQKCEKEFHTIGDNVFRCLDTLERLSIHLHVLEFVGNKTLAGLSKLSVLDLSKCYMLSSLGVARLLSDEGGLSDIHEIILSETGLYCRPNYFEINEALIDQLGKRRVSSVNLSSGRTYVKEFGMTSFERFCSSIVTLNMSDSVVVRSHVFKHQKPCSSLRVLDVSGVNPTRINSLFPDKVLSINDTVVVIGEQLYPMLLRPVSSLYLNNVISKEHVLYLRNVSITLTAHNNLKELYVCGYNVPVVDFKVFLTYQFLEKFVLSDNSIETLSADVFKNFTLLRQIDISNNRLGHSKSINTTFSNLFRTNNVLSIILMAGNGIHNLPSDTFMLNTMLETIDISENAFQQITFGIDHLRHLKVLDMRNNAIQYLNAFSRNSLDMLYNHPNEQTEEASHQLFVDLRGNPFTCSCESLDFLKWFALSPIFKSTRYQYSCKIDGQTFSMTSAAISVAIDDCEKPIRRRRKLVLATLLPILAATAILASVIAIIKLRRIKIRQDRIQLIQNGDKFLTFLSFSGEDKQFVADNILQPLKDNMEALLDTDRDLICVGDRYFRLGRTIFSEMLRCLDRCSVFIAVMSRNYCNSEHCQREIEEARVFGMPIILIFIEHVDEEDMSRVTREVFRYYTRANFIMEEGVYRLNMDWESVCESIIQLVKIE